MTDTTEKNALRRKMRAARKACTDRATRDDCLLQRLMALSAYQKASCVLSYVSFGTEADTLRILDRVLADGKALYVPKCVPNTNRMGFTSSRLYAIFRRALTAFWSRKKQRHIKMRRMHCALCRDWRFQQTAHGSGTAKGTTIRFLRSTRF